MKAAPVPPNVEFAGRRERRSVAIAAPDPEVGGRRLLPQALGDLDARVKFVLRCRISEQGMSHAALLRSGGPGLPATASVLSHRLSQRLVNDDGTGLTKEGRDLIAAVEQTIGDRTTSQYVQRVLPRAPIDQRGDSAWWPAYRERLFHNPVDVIVAALSLAKALSVDPGAGDGSFAEGMARRRLALALCRVATGHYGYAQEATTLIARLAPVMLEELREFITVNPKGPWLCRAADRAIRFNSADLVTVNKLCLIALQAPLLPETPPRVNLHVIRLLRCVALRAPSSGERMSAADRLLLTAQNRDFDIRSRRFALWVAAEAAVNKTLESSSFDEAIRILRRTPVLSDVAREVAGWKQWIVAGDSYDIVNRDNRGDTGENLRPFHWPLHEKFAATSARIDEMVPFRTSVGDTRPAFGAAHAAGQWNAVRADVRFRAIDLLHEALVHPGYVRAQVAIDMFTSGGDRVRKAVAKSASLLIAELANDLFIHHGGVMQSAIHILGTCDDGAAIEQLCSIVAETSHERSASPGWKDRHGWQSDAVWALGDILSRQDPRDHAQNEAPRRMLADLLSVEAAHHVSVIVAAIHAVHVAEFRDFEPHLTKLIGDHPSNSVRRWAAWCLNAWDTHSLTSPVV